MIELTGAPKTTYTLQICSSILTC